MKWAGWKLSPQSQLRWCSVGLKVLKAYQGSVLPHYGDSGPTISQFDGDSYLSLDQVPLKKIFQLLCKRTVVIGSWGRPQGHLTSDCYRWVRESSIPWNVLIPGSCIWPDFQIESQTGSSPGICPLSCRVTAIKWYPSWCWDPGRVCTFHSWTKVHNAPGKNWWKVVLERRSSNWNTNDDL